MEHLSGTIDKCVEDYIETIRSAVADIWPPIADMPEADGCARLIDRMYEAAKSLCTETMATLTAEQCECLHNMVRRKAQILMDEWKHDANTPAPSFCLAPITKRGMPQPKKKKRNR